MFRLRRDDLRGRMRGAGDGRQLRCDGGEGGCAASQELRLGDGGEDLWDREAAGGGGGNGSCRAEGCGEGGFSGQDFRLCWEDFHR